MGSFIPIIDLADDAPEVQARRIKESLGSIGFFQVQNSGLKAEDIAAMFEHSRAMFLLPLEEKLRFAANKIGSGYVKPREQALGLYKRDNKEAFQYGRQSAHLTQPLPEPFHPDSTALRDLIGFYRTLHNISERLLELFAQALGLPFEHFRKAHSFGLNTAVSMIHYPPLTAEEHVKATETDIRAGEHKDWGTLTMLFQQSDGQPGLQVYLPRSSIPESFSPVDTLNNSEYPTEGDWGWYEAPIPPEGSFLVNVGLAMELWSGGAYKATLHRVVLPPAPAAEEQERGIPDRYTMAYFVQPDDEVEIQPVMEGGKIDHSVPSITSGALFGGKLQESLDRINNLPDIFSNDSGPNNLVGV